MELLNVGKSLRGVTNEPSPYKIAEQHFLPKFASVGRPVSLAPTKERLAKPIPIRSAVRAMAAAAPAMAPVPMATNARAAVPHEVKRPPRAAKETKGWLGFFSFAAPSKSRKRPPLVQGEMTLESLKVVRNDLSEADLEVVPVKLGASTEPVPATEDLPVAGSVWRRAAARWSSVTRLWL